ncbi:uncharacterized protein K452DRAFT_300312 [Aplosporella prunicola CBS 121167]|uniref:Uncharacterized protein n=1 Tax=Aplosporella prunicola CBS 121167 TaxID=1176127 RepID=A0A6A6B8M2_9PEZI|nr:uncharacterized protein K452DRAFT_300312 [Aplosporella prunicola CBS 121167]KAF2139237.1 hypothetical protein K452DRAFT_300312 [Aplosporella prunicola CBS 121167]
MDWCGPDLLVDLQPALPAEGDIADEAFSLAHGHEQLSPTDNQQADLALPAAAAAAAAASPHHRHQLRLPSFDLLGIAAPHPDRFHPATALRGFSPVGAGPLSKPEDPLHAQSPPRPGPERERKSYEQSIDLLTPPPDPSVNYWGSFAHVRAAAMDSPPDHSDRAKSLTPPSNPAADLAIRPGPPSDDDDGDEADDDESWLHESLRAIVANLDSAGACNSSVKVLSHALPCPSPTGQAFPRIIQAIHEAIPPRSTVWINVFHAVPGRFNMADLPTSPPSTPGPVIGGDDYFTTKVFDSAVPVTNYEGDAKVLRSPRPAVAPGTVDVSIVERYIPPTSASEFAGLFSTNGSRSLLLDRFVELSPDNGTLIFLYPTKTGAKTFTSEYLGPILDPILRAMHVVHDLSADLGASLGRMQAVNHLYEYEDMAERLRAFCHRLSNENTSLDRFNGARTSFSVVHSEKKQVRLGRKEWASDWWIKQEKPRVRAAVSKYFRMAQKVPADAEIMPTNLIQEILDGVNHKQYEYGEPSNGVEVGIFVIKRSSGSGSGSGSSPSSGS